MSKSQTVIAIRRDKVESLRKLNRENPNFLKTFVSFHSVSNYPAYLSDSIFVSHSEHENINACHIITPFLGSTFSNIFHKSFDKKDNGEVVFHDKTKIIENLIMGYKGVFTVDNIDKLEIQSDFATHKNSVYSVFGIQDDGFETLNRGDFEEMLDIVDFVERDKNIEQDNIKKLNRFVTYMGAFAQRQACLAFQSNGLFKAYPFKSNKKIHLDVEEILKEFKEEAYRLNHRFSFADKHKQQLLLLNYVSSYDFRENLSEELFEAFIDGLKGKAVKVISDKDKKAEEVYVDPDENDDDD